jgi:DNA-binding MarR family transcriptional regulator
MFVETLNKISTMMTDNDRSITIEVPQDVHAVFYSWEKRHLRGKGNYIRVFQDVLLEMAKDRELNLTDHRVLLLILTKLGYENFFSLSQTEMGELLGINQANISRSLQKLEQRGFITLLDTPGRKKVYMVNPHIVFKTKAKDLKELEEDWALVNSEHHKASA